MTRENIVLWATFLALLFFQPFVFNQFQLFGSIYPLVYLLFLVLYPFDQEQALFIVLGFCLGLGIDFLGQTAGAHTVATLTTAFVRPKLIRYAYGSTAEIPARYIDDSRTFNNFLFLVFLITFHHFLYFIMVYFSWDALGLIAKNTFFTSLFSLLLISLISRFYSK